MKKHKLNYPHITLDEVMPKTWSHFVDVEGKPIFTCKALDYPRKTEQICMNRKFYFK